MLLPALPTSLLIRNSEHGAKFPNIFMKYYSESNRGVHARIPIREEDEVMRIPRDCLVTVEMGKECDIGIKMARSQNSHITTKHNYLSMFVLQDKESKTSFFQPFYDILPENYSNMPIFWGPEELALLEGSYILTQINDRKRNIKRDYDLICEHAPEFGRFTPTEFCWARMMVASRNFGIEVDKVKTDALVPLADMLNHFRPRETKWSFHQDLDKNGAFTITALCDLEQGAQIYDSYGKKCNHRFLLNYGFAVEHNRDADGRCHNEVRVVVDMPDDVPMYGTKVNLLEGSRTDKGMRVSMYYDDKSTREALSYLRFINAAGNEVMMLPPLGDDADLGANPLAPISIANETVCLRTLATLMQRQLDRYPTSWEDDTEFLEVKKRRLTCKELRVSCVGASPVCFCVFVWCGVSWYTV